MPEELISAGEFATFHHIQLSFIQTLHDSGLISMTIRDGAFFLDAGELSAVERFVRWHYELSINTEGIEALSHMLGRVEELKEENRILKNQLAHYKRLAGGPVEPGEMA